jgi:hypothetical protein
MYRPSANSRRADFFLCLRMQKEEIMPDAVLFRSSEEIEHIVRRFEDCDFAKGEFTHSLHLAVAAWYEWQYTADEALARMRSGLTRLTDKFGVKAYHETMTGCWMKLLQGSLDNCKAEASFVDIVNLLIARYNSKEVIYEYYTRELLSSEAAKRGWVEPDLKPIFPCASGTM